MEDDGFLEQFQNKDLSKIKKFNFKKAKAVQSSGECDSPANPIHDVPNSRSTKSECTSKNLAADIKSDNSFREQFEKKNGSTSYTFSCCKTKALNGFLPSPSKKFLSEPNNVANNKSSLSPQKINIPSNKSEIDNAVSKTLNGSLQNSRKKFTFKRKDEISANKFAPTKLNSPLKDNPTDNFLDSLYKSTNDLSPAKISNNGKSAAVHHPKLSLSLKKTLSKPNSHEGSPSLLSGRSKGTFNLSKYFSSENKGDSPKTNQILPFKKLLQSKNASNSVQSTNETVEKSLLSRLECNNEVTKNDSSSSNSPVIKPKKFVFKKKPLSTSRNLCFVQAEENFDLNNILGEHTLPSKQLSTPNNCEYNTLNQNDLSLNNSINNYKKPTRSVEGDFEADSKTKNEAFNDLLSNSESVSPTQPLEITDADYMDDEEFERRFGSLAEQFDDSNVESISDKTSNDQTYKNSPEITSSKSDEPHNTDELLNEISNINWDENGFDDEPVQEGFKDRDDDSEQFRGQYEHSEVMMEVLHQKFGLRNFRPHQREIINASLTQHDCFVLMPTGGGKSLCYQLPAILMPGLTIVVSPLRALISDQVDKLNALDIAAAHLCSDVSKTESEQIYMKLSMREPGLKLLYLTPEKICASRIIIDMLNSLYQRGKLARFVIDEVHCLSQWGHDFRPDYKQLGLLRTKYKEVPIICLTATATKQVENDVINILHLKNVKRFIRSFNRPNIKYEVIDKKGKATDAIAHLIKSKFAKKSGIVYCLGRKDCDNLADDLNRMGVKAKPYHAGMNDKVREAIQREWMQDRFHVIVATIAFGMGIDKPDVRFVIHNSIPKSVEAFYQESGRAGRDGEVSYSFLFYSYGDVGRLQKLIQMDRNMNKKTLEAHFDSLKQMASFAENVVDCRRYLQLIHLGEHFDRRICIRNAATTCDNCENVDKYKALEVTKQAKELCALVQDISGHGSVTMLYMADVYRGAKVKKILERRHNEHRFYGAGASMDRNDVHRVLKELILKNILQDFCTFTGDFPVVYIKPGPKFYQFFNSNRSFSISVCTDKRRQRTREPVAQTSGWVDTAKVSTTTEVVRHSVQKQNTAKLQAARKLQLTQIKVQCHEELLEECRRLAMERNLTLSSVMNLSAIKSMSDHLPATKEDMLKIQHVTDANYSKYGDYFLKVTQKYRAKHDAIQPLATLAKDQTPSTSAFREEEEDFHSAGSGGLGFLPLPQSGGRGVKRKGGWGAGKKSGPKRKKFGSKRKKGKWTSPKGKATSSGWKGKGGKGPLHIK